MIRWIYSILIQVVVWLMPIPAMFNPKLRQGAIGRRQTFGKLKEAIQATDRTLWMHVSSLGEFEQGRPVLDRLRATYPNHKIILTFFSPSGYNIRKDYPHADLVCYLPWDTAYNVHRFFEAVHPELAIFVKYDLWPNYLHQIKHTSTRSILISAVAQVGGLVKYAPRFQHQLLSTFDVIAVQDEASRHHLEALNIASDITVSGDTRIDRTLAIASDPPALSIIEKFCGDQKIFIAGSTWPTDEAHLAELVKDEIFQNWKLIIAPHDVSGQHINELKNRFPSAVTYGQPTINGRVEDQSMLIINTIGLLNKIYQYGHLAYIGGGFGTGIHNTLEPAAFGLPVIFGPKYDKFIEAKALVQIGGARSIRDGDGLVHAFYELEVEAVRSAAAAQVRAYMQANQGATDVVMESIKGLMVD